MSKLSKFKGVSFAGSGRKNPWRSRISINGETLFLGYFKSQKDAAEAYNFFVETSMLYRPLNKLG